MPASPPPDNETISRSREIRSRRRDGIQKAVLACDRCRLKKIKCDGTTSCQSCVAIGFDCHYSRTVRRYRGSSIAKAQKLQRRLGDAERLLRTAGLLEELDEAPLLMEDIVEATENSPQQTARNSFHSAPTNHGGTFANDTYRLVDTLPAGLDSHVDCRRNFKVGSGQHSITTASSSFPSSAFDSETCNITTPFTLPTKPTTSLSAAGIHLTNAAIGNYHAHLQHRAPSAHEDLRRSDPQEPPSQDEIHGPNSYLSICADPGVKWIATRIGVSNYATCAVSAVSTISQKLKLRQSLSLKRISDPPLETAWLFTRAYFDESLEATYHIIDQASFEQQLREHYNNALCDKTPGWYALRNVVFASGCRIATYKSCTWMEAQTLAQGYFDNALSVEADLLHGTPGILAIQALIIMALFAEGLGTAKLEYMLVSCAVRLAFARGLNLQPTTTNISFQETQRRSWIFWTIYCFEKQLTLRAGRPSAIDDDDISCDLPTWAPDTNSNFVECFRQTVSLAMLSSAIAKSFTTVKARKRSFVEKAELVQTFHEKLQSWHSNLPRMFKVAFPLEAQHLPRGVRAEHVMYLYLSYHGNMTAIHSILGHPWNLPAPDSADQLGGAVCRQIDLSDKALANASQKIIIITRSVSVDAAAPVWLVFYYPLLGMINMFISILKAPASESTAKSIGVIDMAAGYFAYLDYSTDSIFSFALIQNLAQWARQAVTTAATRVPEPEVTPPGANTDVVVSMHDFHANSIPEMGICDIDGMTLGDWPAFLLRLPQFTT
ncbi:hypothetical protein CC86DRAFT_369390 [Ophiobolus disseminans]|uniref:Zn(2)-C6 fungal-type domain-containing protein n=1 Tax=Ophiobolus disseminans TaxID=1469910 RepID=A0A6A7A399_9PLEO|nr:hypothetical protein CC86DRAFT_369390 [Ophiobolus disseminans]